MKIVDIQLGYLAQRLATRKFTLIASDAARARLAEKGYEPDYGARPLKRLIQKEVENPLALKVLDGKFREGDVLRLDVKDGAFVFEKAAQGTGA